MKVKITRKYRVKVRRARQPIAQKMSNKQDRKGKGTEKKKPQDLWK